MNRSEETSNINISQPFLDKGKIIDWYSLNDLFYLAKHLGAYVKTTWKTQPFYESTQKNSEVVLKSLPILKKRSKELFEFGYMSLGIAYIYFVNSLSEIHAKTINTFNQISPFKIR